jgi:putative heme-binding domain-containing protein
MMRNPAVHVRALAATLLLKRGTASVSALERLLSDNDHFVQARAVWLLARLGPEGRLAAERMLRDPDPLLRAAAFRAMRETTADVMALAGSMIADTSAFVRREVAVALRDAGYDRSKPLLIKLAAAFEGTDRWYIEALADACAGHEADFYQSLADAGIVGGDPLHWNQRTAALAWRLHPDAIVPDLRARAAASVVPAAERSRALTALGFINTTQAVHAMLELSRSPAPQVANEAKYWLAFRQSNAWIDLTDWAKSGMDPALEKRRADMTVKAGKLLNAELPVDERKWNARDMARDEVGAQMLIDLVAAGKVPRTYYPAIEEVIFRNPSLSIRMQAGHYFTKPGVSRTYSIPAITQLVADGQHGAVLFAKHCAPCHRVGDTGSDIGPELTHIGSKFDQTAALDAIVNPSAGIVFGYEPYLVTTKSGASYYGFLVADGKQAVVIRDLAGRRHTIRTSEIGSRKLQQNSLMPEPSSFGFSEQDLADVSGYLMSLK